MTSTITVSTPEALMAALAAANGGEVIQLAAGDYGRLLLNNNLRSHSFNFESDVKITAADPNNPPSFSSMRIIGVDHLHFDNINFDYKFNSGDGIRTTAFRVDDSNHFTISNSRFIGDLASGTGTVDDGYPIGKAFSIFKSNNIALIDNEVSHFWKGILVRDATDVVVAGNNVHSLRSDGMNFVNTHNLLIEENQFHNFIRNMEAGDHADMIQFFTDKTDGASSNVIIRSNIFDIGEALRTQSLFMRNEEVDLGRAGKEMYYRNILIENNIITNGHLNGITVGETDGLIIRNNTVLAADGTVPGGAVLPVQTPRIRVSANSENVVIENNITSRITGFNDQPSWFINNNIFVQKNDPTAPNWYGDIFIPASLELQDGRYKPVLIPGSEIDLSGIGSTLSRVDGTLPYVPSPFQPVFPPVQEDGQYWMPDTPNATEPVPPSIGTIRLPNNAPDIAVTEVVASLQQVQTGGDGIAAAIARSTLAPILRSNDLTITFDMTADQAGDRGEIMRIHGNMRVLVQRDGSLSVEFRNTENVPVTITSGDLRVNDGKEYAIAIQLSNNMLSLSVDGQTVGQTSFTGGLRNHGSHDLTFGNSWHSAGSFFNGTIENLEFATTGFRPANADAEPRPFSTGEALFAPFWVPEVPDNLPPAVLGSFGASAAALDPHASFQSFQDGALL